MSTRVLTCQVALLAAAVLSFSLPASFAGEPAPRNKYAQFEIKFMENMIDHHSMAVMMAAMCEDRALHPQLLSQCDRITVTQSAEIAEMQMWLADWYGIDYEPQMSRKMERQLEELAELDGQEFEIAFMDMMIEHHATAIKEARECVRKAYHAKLIQLCQSIVNSQQRESVLMQTWLCDWYDLCDGKGHKEGHGRSTDQRHGD